jgi:NTE family protein
VADRSNPLWAEPTGRPYRHRAPLAMLEGAMSSNGSANGSAPRVAVVLPGGGARGAYEAGALSVLLPALEERGERVTVMCGTSVGAINAALLGSLADRSAAEQAAASLARWRSMRKGEVIRPIVGPSLPLMLLRFLGDALEIPGVRLASLMDPAPMRESLERWVDWLALHRNVRQGVVDAVCVVATSLSRGGPVAFVHSRERPPRSRPADTLHYVASPLTAEHVRASAAIPMLFPPVEVTSPPRAAGFYIDGGTRMNSPIAPALALGADRVIVIGFEPFGARGPAAAADQAPRLADVTANVLDGLLVDQVADDLHRLAAINSFYIDAPASGPSRSARAYRTSRGRQPYRKISYALVAPEHRGELGEIAEQVFQDRYGGLRGLLSPDYPLISRLLGGGRSRARGELLSFLLFDEVYVEELLAAGRRDAQRWLDRHPRFWCSDAAHDFDVAGPDHEGAREEALLDEWRALRRR